jgi:adenine-specific DNA-methyltransferase
MPFLDWVNKAQAVQTAAAVPYHLLNLDGVHGDPASDNLLIQGDNLLALKALLPFYRGRVKCVFIDPPYNTQSAFEHYDDKLEHSQWLSMMHPRLVLLRDLLAPDGSIWVTIDDNEAHYLKVLMDEVFGRHAFVSSIAWQKTLTRRNDARNLSEAHDHLLVYSPLGNQLRLRRLEADSRQRATYTNRDKDPRGDWLAVPFHAPNIRPNLTYAIATPSGRVLMPPPGRCWSTTQEQYEALRADNRIYFGRNGAGMAQRKKFWSESEATVVPWTWWPHEEAGENREAKAEAKTLAEAFEVGAFGTPKPERLLQRVLHIASNPGDLVLDSFLGSGTTAAVAHKMGRRWIGIEMGEHARTHCLPRLQEVIAGEQGGISKAVGWQGGGGFRFQTLGEPVFDAHGAIHPQVRFAALAAYLWHFETGEPAAQTFASPLLGVHQGTAYCLLYNGVLGDRRPAGGNVLTGAVLAHLQDLLAAQVAAGGEAASRFVVYGETSRLGEARLQEAAVSFRQIPYDIQAR